MPNANYKPTEEICKRFFTVGAPAFAIIPKFSGQPGRDSP